MAKHPGLRPELHLEDRPVDLLFEGIDVAIRVGLAPPESTEIVAHRLFSYPRVLVASPDYLRRRGEPRTPEALAKHDALTHVAGFATSWTLASEEREARVRVSAVFRCNALHAVRDLAVRGAGIAMLPAWFVPEELASGALRTVLPGWHNGPVEVNALHRTQHRGTPRVLALIDHLRAAYAPSEPRPAPSPPGRARRKG
jgi:DNA-binding transcriptional LysR family regulator